MICSILRPYHIELSLVKSRHEVVCPQLIVGSLHILPKYRELCTSCIILHPILGYSRVTGPISYICIRIADEKAQVQGHWACPKMLITLYGMMSINVSLSKSNHLEGFTCALDVIEDCVKAQRSPKGGCSQFLVPVSFL